MKPVVPFRIEDVQLALGLERVVKVLRMAALTSLPDAAGSVRGVLELHDGGVAAVDLRRCFGLAAREPGVNDLLLLTRTPQRLLALIVDSVGVVRLCADEQLLEAGAAGLQLVGGGGGLLLIDDLEGLLAGGAAA